MLTREPQYAASFEEEPVTLGPMASSTWRWDPKRLGFTLARYKFVAKMLSGMDEVAEIGCGDGWASEVVRSHVGELHLYDFDEAWKPPHVWDIVKKQLPYFYEAIYMLDVLEHIRPEDEPLAMLNICDSLLDNGVFIAGSPSLESQVYASPGSIAGHVNCKSGETMKKDALRYFKNVFLFGMNDETLHTGFSPMCHYNLILATGVR